MGFVEIFTIVTRDLLDLHPISFLSIYKQTQTHSRMYIYTYISHSLCSPPLAGIKTVVNIPRLEVRLTRAFSLLGRFGAGVVFLFFFLQFATIDAAAIFQEELTC